jgi:hypothetical protein
MRLRKLWEREGLAPTQVNLRVIVVDARNMCCILSLLGMVSHAIHVRSVARHKSMRGPKCMLILFEVVLDIGDARSVAWYTSIRVAECILPVGICKLLHMCMIRPPLLHISVVGISKR